jgi:glycosyltransferase involved in cell wall biosynthesis
MQTKSPELKLSCTMIVRDEAATLRACLESIRPHVDEFVIVDTGSKDDSPSIARSLADKFEVWTGCNDAEGRIRDFSAARNRALELATGDALCWFDGDDVVRGGENLRKLVSEAHTQTAGQPFAWLAPYEYERDARGRVTTLQWRERIVYPRAGWEWRGPVHEGHFGRSPNGSRPRSLISPHPGHRVR